LFGLQAEKALSSRFHSKYFGASAIPCVESVSVRGYHFSLLGHSTIGASIKKSARWSREERTFSRLASPSPLLPFVALVPIFARKIPRTGGKRLRKSLRIKINFLVIHRSHSVPLMLDHAKSSMKDSESLKLDDINHSDKCPHISKVGVIARSLSTVVVKFLRHENLSLPTRICKLNCRVKPVYTQTETQPS